MNIINLKEMSLQRFEVFIYRNRVVLTSICEASTPISWVCRVLGLSPDVVIKRVRYRLICNDDLPF